LTAVAPGLVHPDQAGFLPGRSITDQIHLASTFIEYAEDEIQNGALVALDQEKAYDKVSHSYLWKTLEAFNIPTTFINTVRYLYTGAETCVIINGEVSSPYTLTRGVRQGDPLSCLLFDLAIEPLAEMLRSSPKLSGFEIPGVTKVHTICLL
jgi:hypothetical protein